MCGRFTLTDPDADLAVQFSLPQIPDMQPRYNIAPTQSVAAVRLSPPGPDREMVLLHWGLIPFWAKDLSMGGRLINARSETVAEKPAFRSAFRRRRCLIVADGFYEWQKQNGAKQPFYIRMRTSRAGVFAGGDVRKDSVGQIASSVGDGVTALIQSVRYLEETYG